MQCPGDSFGVGLGGSSISMSEGVWERNCYGHWEKGILKGAMASGYRA